MWRVSAGGRHTVQLWPETNSWGGDGCEDKCEREGESEDEGEYVFVSVRMSVRVSVRVSDEDECEGE